MTRSSSMAASMLCRDLLGGPRTTLTTALRSQDAWLLMTGGSGELVSLVTPRAVVHPRSLIVPELPRGSPRVSIGHGALWYGDLRVTIGRWFTPARVVRGALRTQAAPTAATRGLVGAWREHLGEGEGLTPYGDDVICGVMLGLLATDHPDADRLAREIHETDLDARTTAPSAAFLRCAGEGWCIPQVERLLRRVSTHSRVDDAVEALLAVGHTSGRGLLTGLACAIDPGHLGLAA